MRVDLSTERFPTPFWLCCAQPRGIIERSCADAAGRRRHCAAGDTSYSGHRMCVRDDDAAARFARELRQRIVACVVYIV